MIFSFAFFVNSSDSPVAISFASSFFASSFLPFASSDSASSQRASVSQPVRERRQHQHREPLHQRDHPPWIAFGRLGRDLHALFAERLEEVRGREGMPLAENTLAELRRDMARLALVRVQIKEIEKTRLERLKKAPQEGSHPMVLMLAKVMSIGIETADMLVHEVLSRGMRDDRAVARYGGITGAPDESGSKRREKGLARAGNARVRRGMIQLAWRWLMFQKDSGLAQWYRARTASARRDVRKTMIVALARKLLIALWRYVTTGEIPLGARLRPAQ